MRHVNRSALNASKKHAMMLLLLTVDTVSLGFVVSHLDKDACVAEPGYPHLAAARHLLGQDISATIRSGDIRKGVND